MFGVLIIRKIFGYVQPIPQNLCSYFKLTSFKFLDETLLNLTAFTEIQDGITL